MAARIGLSTIEARMQFCKFDSTLSALSNPKCIEIDPIRMGAALRAPPNEAPS